MRSSSDCEMDQFAMFFFTRSDCHLKLPPGPSSRTFDLGRYSDPRGLLGQISQGEQDGLEKKRRRTTASLATLSPLSKMKLGSASTSNTTAAKPCISLRIRWKSCTISSAWAGVLA